MTLRAETTYKGKKNPLRHAGVTTHESLEGQMLRAGGGAGGGLKAGLHGYAYLSGL